MGDLPMENICASISLRYQVGGNGLLNDEWILDHGEYMFVTLMYIVCVCVCVCT